MHIKLVHRQIFKELWLLFALTLGALLMLLLIGRMLQLREVFLAQSLGFFDLARLFFYLSPFFLLFLIPVACMLSVFLTFLRMSTDRELIALKATGISLYRIIPAPLAFCLICMFFNGVVSFVGLSWGMDNFRATLIEFAKTKTQLVLQPGVFNTDFPGLTIYAQKVDSSKGRLELIMVRDETREDVSAMIIAPEGYIGADPEKGQVNFVMNNGRIYRQEKQKLGVLKFDNYVVKLDLTRLLPDYDLDEVKPKEMSFGRLVFLAGDPETREEFGVNYARKVRVEMHKRMVLPLACLVLGIFAVPLASAFEGLKRQYGLVLAMGFFLFYYTILSLAFSLGEAGAVSPGTALWLPNLALLAAGAVGIHFTSREKKIRVLDWFRRFRRAA